MRPGSDLSSHAGGRAGLVAFFVAPLLALAGCGGVSQNTTAQGAAAPTRAQTASAPASSPSSVSATGQAPCDLLSQQDAEAAVGQALAPDPSNDRSASCNYVSSDNLGYGVSVTPGSWDSLKTEAGDAPHVSGIGDEALNHDGLFLFVRKGTRGFALNMRDHSSSPDARLAKARELALKIVARFI